MATTGGNGGAGDLRRVNLPEPCETVRELSPAQVGQAVEHSSVAVIITDPDGRIVYGNPCFTSNTGYSLAEIVGKTPRILKSGHTRESEYRKLWSLLRQGDEWHGEFCNRRKDGTLYWINSTISPVKAADGTITHFIAVQVDIGQHKRAEHELRSSEQRFRSLVENSPLGICIEQNGKPLFVNRSFAAIFGYDDPDDVIRLGSLQPLYVQNDLGRPLRSRQSHRRGRTSLEYQIRGVKKDGSIIWLQTQATSITWNGEPAEQLTVVDVTSRKSREDRLHRQANYDPLTNLPGRKLALDRLESAIVNARRRCHRLAALFIDVDRFKSINDALGHVSGDRLLRQLAERVRSSIREQDTVARLGGDEFIVVLPEIHQQADAEAVADKILEAVVRPFVLDGQETFITVSIGVAVFPDQGDDAEALIQHADTAMYVAKESGRGSVHIFTDELGRRKRTRARLEAGLRQALERDEFSLCYQPLIDIRSGRIVGAEALLRWFNPEYGQISPQQFVRLAEHTGLIVPIGEWVLTTGCREARRWLDAGFTDVCLSVNVSNRQFRGNLLLDSVRRAMAANRLAPEYLELEFTESLLLEDLAEIKSTLRDLESCGVRLAMDDFGTGYSALGYLNRVPLDTLKIDRSFIIELLTNPGQSSLVDALILMAHRLKLRVIAEGVESGEQLEALRGRGCDLAQGFYLSPPLPAGEFLALLGTWRWSTACAG